MHCHWNLTSNEISMYVSKTSKIFLSPLKSFLPSSPKKFQFFFKTSKPPLPFLVKIYIFLTSNIFLTNFNVTITNFQHQMSNYWVNFTPSTPFLITLYQLCAQLTYYFSVTLSKQCDLSLQSPKLLSLELNPL